MNMTIYNIKQSQVARKPLGQPSWPPKDIQFLGYHKTDFLDFPSPPPTDITWAVVTAWRITRKTIRTALYCIVHHNCSVVGKRTLMPWLQLRFDYDTTTIRLRRIARACFHSMSMSIFRRSHVVVVLQSNRTQIVISITSVLVECVVVSSYRSRIALVI